MLNRIKYALGLDYKSRCIREVLTAFKHMGASDEELRREKEKLLNDEWYLAEWSIACNPPQNQRKRA
jgi:hypothetical protein